MNRISRLFQSFFVNVVVVVKFLIDSKRQKSEIYPRG